ncbi:peptidoglycan D,D-transpeptidase FtsI family protein [Carbonactinospora thermoautotrophica]|uniref:peptidoglycan D,D-transpeptidase FtsI family protein n=2 Tax=Carbonactinospora thermoautotrophica TaxID=1469144 RepID=UPI001146A35A|nr:penicillin-binding protein 2 [Carbonactinospora thermoautotrophica]
MASGSGASRRVVNAGDVRLLRPSTAHEARAAARGARRSRRLDLDHPRQPAPRGARSRGRYRQPPRRSKRPPRRPSTMRLGNPAHRLRIILLVLAFVLSIFAGRLLQLQGVDAPRYATLAEKETLTEKDLPAPRGQILDRDGMPLAMSLQTVDVIANPKLWHDPCAWRELSREKVCKTENARADAARALQGRLRQLQERGAADLGRLLRRDPAQLAADLARNPKSQYRKLATQVDPLVWRKVRALKLPGITREPGSARLYPGGALAANVLGFVDHTGRGQGGLEKALDRVLAGRNGKLVYLRTESGWEIPTAGGFRRDPQPGENVQLTIDRDIQWLAEQEIAAGVRKWRAKSGTVVVMNVRTGEILAMATAPSFDPNRLDQADPRNLGNRALTEVYEPGSTGKVITMAAVIEEGKAQPTDRFHVPPAIACGGHEVHDHYSHGWERLTLNGILAKSSNIGTIQAAERIGPETLYRYEKLFGIGEPTGIGFPGEARGILEPPGKWYGSKRCAISFGQGMAVNAVQVTSVFATIANGGVRVQPTLVKGYVDAEGRFRPAPEPKRTRVVSEQTAKTVTAMLESVVSEDGTAPAARIPGYVIAGKTGTAQKADPACHCYNDKYYTASFIGFAPADKPELVVSVTLQDPQGWIGGGRTAAPIFRQVTEFALKTLKIPPSRYQPVRLPLEW